MVRDQNAGRRVFCNCGAVMIVPSGNGIAQHQDPELIGHIDLHAAARRTRFLVVGGALVIVILSAIVYGVFVRNAWERENGARLLSLKTEADALVEAKEYEKAKVKFDELFSLLRDQTVSGHDLKTE